LAYVTALELARVGISHKKKRNSERLRYEKRGASDSLLSDSGVTRWGAKRTRNKKSETRAKVAQIREETGTPYPVPRRILETPAGIISKREKKPTHKRRGDWENE